MFGMYRNREAHKYSDCESTVYSLRIARAIDRNLC